MTNEEETLVRNARSVAHNRCAFVSAILDQSFAPPPDGRVHPLELQRRHAREAAEKIFDQEDPNMDFIGKVIGEMKNWLMPSTSIVKADPEDARCGSRAAFVIGNRPPIQLCPSFFEETTSDESRTRTMIHEAAHLTGIGDPDGELYYFRFNCADEDPEFEHRKATDRRRVAQADTWAKYVHCISGQPPDRVDVLKPEKPPGPKEPPSGKIHVVQAGDYLVKIAQRYYGDGALWRKIYDANRSTIGPNPDKIYPGQQLMIP